MTPFSANPAGLRVGAAVTDLTPTEPAFLYGYPHVPRTSEGTHDPLECAAMCLRGETSAALFLANDVIWFTRDFAATVRGRIARRTGIPPEAIMITATHTHSGPVMSDPLSNACDPVVPPVNWAYLDWAAEQMTLAAESAVRTAVPAELGLVVARAEGVGTNRHDPAGPADPDVPVLLARALDGGRPIACMLAYAMHPTVLHEDSRLFSADFPGFTRRYLRTTALPADCPVLYHSGAAGNQSPRHVARANTLAEARLLGESLGRAVARALEGATFRADAPIRAACASIVLEPRRIADPAAAQQALLKARAEFARLKTAGAAAPVLRTAECAVFGAEETAELARAAQDGRLAAAVATASPAEIQVVRIGPWAFVGWPGEFFVEYALELKACSKDTFLITLANGELQGYLVTAEAAERGGYEATNAIFAPSNGPRFVAATLDLLAVLR